MICTVARETHIDSDARYFDITLIMFELVLRGISPFHSLVDLGKGALEFTESLGAGIALMTEGEILEGVVDHLARKLEVAEVLMPSSEVPPCPCCEAELLEPEPALRLVDDSHYRTDVYKDDDRIGYLSLTVEGTWRPVYYLTPLQDGISTKSYQPVATQEEAAQVFLDNHF